MAGYTDAGLAGRRRHVERRGLHERIQGYLMGAIMDGSPMIGPSLFRAQTVMWGRFDAYATGGQARWNSNPCRRMHRRIR